MVALCAQAQAHAQATVDAEPAPLIDALQSTREGTRQAAEWLARRVDSWFGDRPFEDGGKVSRGQLTLALFRRSDQALQTDLRFNAEFHLPNVERSAYLFVGRDDPRTAVRGTPDDQTRQRELQAGRPGERAVLAGLGLTLLPPLDLRLGVGPGLKPYAQARYWHRWQAGPGQVDFRETLFWTAADQIGSTTTLAYGQVLSPSTSLRLLNTATVTQATRNVAWQSVLGWYQGDATQKMLSLELLATGSGQHGTGVGASDLGVLARWEQPFYRPWLRGEVLAGHFWPQLDAQSGRGQAWALGVSLKLGF